MSQEAVGNEELKTGPVEDSGKTESKTEGLEENGQVQNVSEESKNMGDPDGTIKTQSVSDETRDTAGEDAVDQSKTTDDVNNLDAKGESAAKSVQAVSESMENETNQKEASPDGLPSETHETCPESVKEDNVSERAVSVSTIQIGHPLAITDSQVMEEDETTYAALRGKANTPASVYTELDARDTRTASRPSAGVRTQEAFYQKAVDLISARCTSSVKMVSTEPLMGVKDPPPGFGAPRVFFIHQRRPRPMTPLKVWRGYHGNVYFEPMKINQANMKEQEMVVNLPPMNRCSEKLQTVISQTRWNPEHTLRYRQNRLMYTPIMQEVPPYERFKRSHRPVLVWDKDAVQRDPEEFDTLQQLESTGTLRIHTAPESQSNNDNGTFTLGAPQRARSPTQKPDKTKVCKGSVARKLVMFRNLMIPLMQEQLGKSSPLRSPADSHSDLHTRDTPTKLPSISAKQTRTPVLRIK